MIIFFAEIPIRAPGVNAEGNLGEIAERTMGGTLEDTSRGILFRKKNNEGIPERVPERSRQDMLDEIPEGASRISPVLSFGIPLELSYKINQKFLLGCSHKFSLRFLPGLSSEIPSLIY